MNSKKVWLLSFLVLAIAFSGLFNVANAEIKRIQGTDYEGDGSRNEFAIPGVEVLMEGDTDEGTRVNLGTFQVMKQEILLGK